ncbi:hypothetical protein [Cellvibrio zantedeschiae]|nr:hypothetical protein [Cellvibrio zantedeschiae]
MPVTTGILVDVTGMQERSGALGKHLLALMLAGESIDLRLPVQ